MNSARNGYPELWAIAAIAILLCAGCGGGGGNPSTSAPAASPPVFTSVPPSGAAEGEVYTYQVAVRDAGGGTVTLALTAAPAGAKLEGTTLTWTPAREQSRRTNELEITATAGNGTTQRQKWSVAPTGSVHIVCVDTYTHAGGSTQVACDMTNFPADILAEATGWQAYSGAGTTDGLLVIPHVPAGNFWLRVTPPDESVPASFFWSDQSTIDFSSLFSYRLDVPGHVSQIKGGPVSGLSPWQSGDEVGWYVPNAGSSAMTYGYALPPGSTEWSDTLPSVPVDPARGDVAHFTQYRRELISEGPPLIWTESAIRTLSLPGLVVTPGETTIITGATTPIAKDRDLYLNLRGDLWKAAARRMYHDAVASARIDFLLYDEPFAAPYYRVAARAELLWTMVMDFPEQEASLGSIPFGDPYSDDAAVLLEIDYGAYAENELMPFVGALTTYTRELPEPATFVGPLIGPVRDIRLGDVNLSAGSHVFTSATPTRLSWTPPPEAARIAGYQILLVSADYQNLWVLRFFTRSNSVNLPFSLAGDTKRFFVIAAYTDGECDFSTRPFIWKYPMGLATALSHSFSGPATTYGASAVKGQRMKLKKPMTLETLIGGSGERRSAPAELLLRHRPKVH